MKFENLLLIADSDRDADLRYATGFHATDPFIWLLTEAGSHGVFSDLEIDRARKHSLVSRVHSLSRLRKRAVLEGEEPPGLAEIAALLCRDLAVKKVVVPARFPFGLARRLRKLGLKVRLREGGFLPEREFKHAAEVKMISAALSMAEVGMSEGILALRKAKIGKDNQLLLNGVPLTSEKLRSVIDCAVLQAGGLPANTIVACGVHACDPHERGCGPLLAHQPIVIDIFPRSIRTGYFGDITRTVVRGRASDAVRRQYAAVRAAQELAFGLLRHGTPAAEVHAAVERHFRDEGFRTRKSGGRHTGFFHSTGHGLGLELHEAPRLSSTSLATLQTGHVVTVEPGLYYPETGGVRLEDVALVTNGHPQNLTKFEKVLEV
ncbi:MAG TPA: Xaa-Pro peptidase family protein [Candidatus Limnocylindria bacterium]|jgi:Xaa-Pro aminopeptidase|nr:Xaa-Pro peptidase family protein [Candidatus Limnocylindria bacterium]